MDEEAAKLIVEAVKEHELKDLPAVVRAGNTPPGNLVALGIDRRVPRHRDLLAGIERNGPHLLALASDLLDLSRLERGYLALRVRPTRLRPLLENCLADFSALATERGLGLYLKSPPCSVPALSSTGTGRVVGVEALLRCNGPSVGLVKPCDLIDVAEESGLDPQGQELELNESLHLQGEEAVLGALAQWKARGIHLAIDDLGTGYSSLAYLKRFPVDKIKIDRSFVVNLKDDPDDRAIVGAMIQIARSLNLCTIAAGVEEAALAGRLRKMGCDKVQGYLYARPLAVAVADQEAWLADQGRRAPSPTSLVPLGIHPTETGHAF